MVRYQFIAPGFILSGEDHILKQLADILENAQVEGVLSDLAYSIKNYLGEIPE